MTTQTTYNPPIQFRAPEITQEQLNDLKEKWGENRSRIIIRCIERIWLDEIGRFRKNENSVEEIG